MSLQNSLDVILKESEKKKFTLNNTNTESISRKNNSSKFTANIQKTTSKKVQQIKNIWGFK